MTFSAWDLSPSNAYEMLEEILFQLDVAESEGLFGDKDGDGWRRTLNMEGVHEYDKPPDLPSDRYSPTA